MNLKGERYWDGKLNRLVRWYYYIQKGLEFVNNFKYVGAFIVAIYFALKLTGVMWLVWMSLISLVILFLLGWLMTWKVAKILDYLSIELSTHWGKYGYELQEQQVELLTKINKKLT